MMTRAALPIDVQDRLGDLEDLVTGLEALSTLLAEIDSMVVKPNQLFCLLHPVVERQRQILDNLRTFY